MTGRKILGALLLAVIMLAAACAAQTQQAAPPEETPAAAVPTPRPTPPTPEPTPAPTPEPTPTPDPIGQQLAAMTLEEKVGQLFIAGFYGTEEGEYVDSLISDYKVGGLIFFGRNVGTAEELVGLMNALRVQNGDYIPLFFSVDQEGGTVERMPPEVARLGNAYDYGRTADGEDVIFEEETPCYRLGQTLAAECKAFGFNLDFAPSLDIWSNPDNTVIGRRAFGTDAVTVASKGPLTAYGLMDSGVIPTLKHFPGHGDTAVDSHAGLPVVEKTREELWQCELIPFAEALSPGMYGTCRHGLTVPAVMVGHILMTAIDPDRPASLSPAVVDGLLREEMGFDGMVVTDDLTMGAVTQNYDLGEAAVLAVEAGCDLLLVCHNEGDLARCFDAVLSAVESGRVEEGRIDESVRRILGVKTEYGLTNGEIPMPDLDALNALIAETQPEPRS